MKGVMLPIVALGLLLPTSVFAAYLLPPGCSKVSPGDCWTSVDCRACCKSTAPSGQLAACVRKWQCDSKFPKACKKS